MAKRFPGDFPTLWLPRQPEHPAWFCKSDFTILSTMGWRLRHSAFKEWQSFLQQTSWRKSRGLSQFHSHIIYSDSPLPLVHTQGPEQVKWGETRSKSPAVTPGITGTPLLWVGLMRVWEGTQMLSSEAIISIIAENLLLSIYPYIAETIGLDQFKQWLCDHPWSTAQNQVLSSCSVGNKWWPRYSLWLLRVGMMPEVHE